jgi:hypothetical protein
MNLSIIDFYIKLSSEKRLLTVSEIIKEVAGNFGLLEEDVKKIISGQNEIPLLQEILIS